MIRGLILYDNVFLLLVEVQVLLPVVEELRHEDFEGEVADLLAYEYGEHEVEDTL